MKKRRLLEGSAYFDLIVKWCGAYLRPGTYNRKYGKHGTYDRKYGRHGTYNRKYGKHGTYNRKYGKAEDAQCS